MPTLKIEKDSRLHKKLVSMIGSRISMALKDRTEQEEKWKKAEETTIGYVHESEADAVRRNKRNNSGDQNYTTIQVPYSYALLMSAHTYQTSVFFGRSPVHQYSGRHGEAEMQVQALEALIGYQTDVGGHLAPYYIWLYDAGKYGEGIIGEYWEEEKLAYGQLVEMPDPVTQQVNLYQATVELPGYKGNKIYNVSPFDFWHDPRVPRKWFQNGEFCFVLKRLTWNDVLRRRDSGYYMNVDELKKHASTRAPDNGSNMLKRPDWSKSFIASDDTSDAARREANQHPSAAFVWEFYVDLVPREWGVGPESYPQKWCFTVTEDKALIIGAAPLGFMHCKFPFSIMENEVEGYATYARGVPQIIEPLQQTMDWLINSHFYNVRAAMNNQFIIDPSKIVLEDVKAGEAGFVWRLRPEAYGTDINKIFKQVPITDVTQRHFSDVQNMFGLGERALGINDQIMGVLNTGGRKTATEVRTAAGFGVNRQKTVTEYQSALSFGPHSQKLVQNSQQFYDGSMKMRIVGDLAMAAGQQFMQVDPSMIMGFFNFVPVDGTLPVDRMAQVNLWKDLMGALRMMPPQVAAGFDWVKIFSWVGTLGGLKNINQFRTQMVADGSLDGQVQAGNVVPIKAGGAPRAFPGADSSTQTGNNALTPAY